MTYQIQIAQERRTGDRATPFFETGQIHVLNDKVQDIDGVLHVETKDGWIPWDYLNNTNILMVACWDNKAPGVTVLKGDYSARTLHFAGWPMGHKLN